MEDDALCGVKMLTREELPADLNPTWRTSHEKFPEAVGKAKRRVHLSPLQIISRQSVRQTAAVRLPVQQIGAGPALAVHSASVMNTLRGSGL